MKKILIILGILLCSLSVEAYANALITSEVEHQQHIDEVGINILNANKIQQRIIFTYNKNEYKKTIDDPTISRRQVVFYEGYFKYVSNDDELAAYLAREISRAIKSYSGIWGGVVASAQVKAAPKKYEIYADKRAVDYMVKAHYNPLGMITFINKSESQGLFDTLLFHNSASKRMAIIYEYIYFNYPEYLKENTYKNNKYYQNFLLNSAHNRALLKEKVLTNSKKELKYE